MATTKDQAVCNACERSFGYFLVHNGFNDSAFAYCDACGMTALFSGWSASIPAGVDLKVHRPITPEVEAFVRPCACGGRFRGTAAPRCPDCKAVLDADAMAEVFERNAPGTAAGWRWQRTWAGLYAVIIDERDVHDPWLVA